MVLDVFFFGVRLHVVLPILTQLVTVFPGETCLTTSVHQLINLSRHTIIGCRVCPTALSKEAPDVCRHEATLVRLLQQVTDRGVSPRRKKKIPVAE